LRNFLNIFFILTLSLLARAGAYAEELAIDPSLLRAAEAEWNKTAVDNTHISILPSSTHAGHRMPLTVVIDQDSPWTAETVTPYLRKTEEIFKQCDLELSPITLVSLFHPGLNDFTPSNDDIVTRDFPLTPRPMAIFTDGLFGYAYANTHLANTGWNKDPKYAHFSEHTVFIDYLAFAYITGGSKKVAIAFQGVVAHELMHTLLDVTHNRIPGNILHENIDQRDFNISAEQCAGMLKNPLVINQK
jgi:hypothetical protein